MDWRQLAAAPPGAFTVEAPAAPVMATRRAAPVHAESTSSENVVTYVAVVDSPAGEYGVARQNND